MKKHNSDLPALKKWYVEPAGMLAGSGMLLNTAQKSSTLVIV